MTERYAKTVPVLRFTFFPALFTVAIYLYAFINPSFIKVLMTKESMEFGVSGE
jgi:hypothetical protein